MCCIDFEKVFDLVKHEKMMDRLRKLGVDLADVSDYKSILGKEGSS
jgi:hypothetical protein